MIKIIITIYNSRNKSTSINVIYNIIIFFISFKEKAIQEIIIKISGPSIYNRLTSLLKTIIDISNIPAVSVNLQRSIF